MGRKRNNRSKRSLGSLPKGLVQRKGTVDINPFEVTSRQKRPKQEVHNRPVSKPKTTKHALENLQRRQTQLRGSLKSSKKSNVFVDRRIGQYDPEMTQEDRMLARLVRERSRQSQRTSKYRLDDDDDDDGKDNNYNANKKNNLQDLFFTHKGKRLDLSKLKNRGGHDFDHDLLSSDDEYGADKGNLAAVDTELHFGGPGVSSAAQQQEASAYGNSASAGLSEIYGHRKTELEDLIARRKLQKAERMQAKESQVETVEKLDESFAELSELLRFRKQEESEARKKEKVTGSLGIKKKLTKEEEEMNEWHLDVKRMMSKPKRKATDRTKTPEEIAKEKAEELHELETRRLARMNGDFDEDDLSDISVDEKKGRKSKKKQTNKKKQRRARNPEELSDSEEESDDEDKLEARFTSDGLVYLNKEGKIVKKLGEEENDRDSSGESSSENDNDDDNSDNSSDEDDDDDSEDDENNDDPLSQPPLSVGTRVRGNYRAAEQHDGQEAWYEGVVSQVHVQSDGTVLYDVDYDDGDFEEGMVPKNVHAIEKTMEEKDALSMKEEQEKLLQQKRQKARNKARTEIPYVFEVPTTLDALHELIAKYASTGADASLIIQRIHASNSVRLDKRNMEKLQNFYDVLLRRFIAVGDAIFASGNGGETLGRYQQLDALTKVMYMMAQEAPESAGAVWSRRLGILQNAHAKRLRDAELLHFDNDDEDDLATAWPSTGTVLLLRALGHIFPVTDRRHYIVTPTILFLGQIVAHTPILSMHDLTMGIICSGLLLEYTKEAQRVVPEALGFLAGVVRLFSTNPVHFPVPNLEAANKLPELSSLRDLASKAAIESGQLPKLSLEKEKNTSSNPNGPIALLAAALDLIETSTNRLNGCFTVAAESELFAEVSESLLVLRPQTSTTTTTNTATTRKLPDEIQQKIVRTATAVAKVCRAKRAPLMRRSAPTLEEKAIKTAAPRMQDPTKYSMSKDKGKKSVQAAIDRTRREYKREHKAISRELRMDSAFIESERRKEQDKKDTKARNKRQKNFAWLEGEQAAMNQQVRQGGGLIKGGGTGLARAKVATAKMGIKKGGRF